MYSVTQTGLSVEQTIWTVWTFSTNTKYHLIAEQTINIFYTNSRSSLTQIISDSLITSQLHIYLTLALSARKIEFWRKKKKSAALAFIATMIWSYLLWINDILCISCWVSINKEFHGPRQQKICSKICRLIVQKPSTND